MKKNVLALVLSGVLLASLGLSSCENISLQNFMPKSVIGAQLNDKGELVLTYSDNTTQNLGVVKGENGKDGADGIDGMDGKDGEDLVACVHTYGDWQTQLSPTCTSIGYNLRTCSLCGDLDYQFVEAIGHTYNEPAVDIVHNCKQHLVSKTCSTCGDTKLEEVAITKHVFEGEWETKEYPCATVKQRPCLYCDEKQTELIETIDFGSHTFDENTLCTTCGHQEFIESEEYITSIPEWGSDCYTWMSVDRTYGLQIMTSYSGTFIFGYAGTPVNVIIPTSIYDISIESIGGAYGFGSVALPFKNCQTIETIFIPEPIGSYNEAFRGSSLKKAYFKQGDPSADYFSKHNPDVEIFYY